MIMRRRIWVYLAFFALLLTGFYLLLPKEMLHKSALPILNDNVQPFSFTDQDGKPVTEKTVEGKVYVTEYFFTTCKGICPIMNANMRRVHDVYKDEGDFMIISHTCMPETDSVHLLKAYEAKMINGKLVKKGNGSYKIEYDTSQYRSQPVINNNWSFVTGDKPALYKMARQGYMIDNNKPDSTQNISNQFIHTQFFALVDKNRRVRAIYDGLNEGEIQKLITDIKSRLKEKVDHKRFMDGFNNNPN
jgi:protein SCO1